MAGGTVQLTLNVSGALSQPPSGVIPAAGLHLPGPRTSPTRRSSDLVATLAASFNGPLSYTDKNALSVGTVADAFSGMTTSEITSTSHDVKLTTVLGDLTIEHRKSVG